MIVGSCYRFSILTARLIRMEYDPDGVFEDRPTQLAVNRFFPAVEFAVHETEEHLEIITDALNIFYDKGPFTVNRLQVKVRSECCGIYCTWNYSEPITEGPVSYTHLDLLRPGIQGYCIIQPYYWELEKC